ncbi:subtilisin-like protease [Dioscorea cayenensis subsp. rotundata]|uniref:Subtilisin-like protease n=1 Tax=Dioscorea cayennensis subsp. rotundata TaxID=55577 RepID=A0AB40CJH8_DIOCR|nr:subtilisin-like protease [Dioscorea cayenensis subsp. rotundata]
MKKNTTPLMSCTITLFIVLLLLLSSTPSSVFCRLPSKASDASQRSTYIVNVLPPEDLAFANPSALKAWHESFLPEDMYTTSNSLITGPRFLYSYTHSYTGFAAKLTKEEVKAMDGKPGFVSAIPDTIYPLLTTHTPHFLGLNIGDGTWNNSNLGKGVIIGILDTGVFASHVSFHDDGLPAPPSKWKGTCDLGTSLCNKKLIGAQAFQSDDAVATATDEVGHGTHTASTAAGNFVDGASFLGIGNGTAVGIAPLAHLAIYKVCSGRGCSSADILAGIDAALKDGVDIISLSLGGPSRSFAVDPVAVGGFRAIEKGIMVSAAGGNDGPSAGTVSNLAPWLLTVAASTNDRRFMATVRLGNGVEFDGETLYHPG